MAKLQKNIKNGSFYMSFLYFCVRKEIQLK